MEGEMEEDEEEEQVEGATEAKPDPNEEQFNDQEEPENQDDSEKNENTQATQGEFNDPALEEYGELEEQTKNLMSIDEIMCVYLREISQKVNGKFYKTLLKFIILFRECLNEYGWQKKSETMALL